MSQRAVGSIALALFAVGCSAPAGAPASSPTPSGQPPEASVALTNPKFFQVSPDDCFWVTHDASLDRVVTTGARLELSPYGEVLASAWESDKAHGGDILLGGLALAPHLGGGYLFWTQSRVFRSTEFTGPLTSVGLGVPESDDIQIRGIRNGLGGAIIATDGGPRELLPGATVATPLSEPAVTDMVALDAKRAVRIDALGSTAWTVDGGKTWNDATPITGIGIRNLGVSADEVWFETYQGRAMLAKTGSLQEPNGSSYRYVDYSRPFQTVFRGTRGDRDDQFWWGYRDLQPLQAAAMSGVRLADGTGLGVVRGAVARVDLTTGRILHVATDWLPSGMDCQPIALGEEVLFACGWEDYLSGGYVLTTNGTEPPHVEHLFTDSGAFVTDDAGGFGYTGSCKAEQKFEDPDRRYGRRYYDAEEYMPANVDPVFCVRRGAGDWVERRLSLDEDTSLLAWIPKRDGTAVALVRGSGRGESLPDTVRDSSRETSQNGVRIVRVFRELQGWYWGAQQGRGYYNRGGNPQGLIDRRYRALDDGTIVGWLSSTSSPGSYSYRDGSIKWTGAALLPNGTTVEHELPAKPSAMAVTGPWGLLTTPEGKLFETLDRGRSWRSAGEIPLAPGTLLGNCSAIGCALSTGARIGWGAGKLTPVITDEKRPDPPAGKPPLVKLSCEPSGTPTAERSNESPAAATLGSQAKVIIQTHFGPTLELIRETPDAISSPSPYSMGPVAPPPSPVPTTTAAPSAPPAAKSAPVRTHTLVFRPPLDPTGPIVRLNATNAAVTGYRSRSPAVALLGAGGEVSYLFYADQNEAIADRNDIVTLPSFNPRGYYYYDSSIGLPGLRTAEKRALIFGDYRRRTSWTSIEEHGTEPQKPPFYFAFDREANRQRVITLGRRDDGSMGLLVLDSAAPEVASVAELDRTATVLGTPSKLAPWSTLTTADKSECASDKKAYLTLIPADPKAYFTLDTEKLPGVTFGDDGLLLVRWSADRVCLEAIDVTVMDPRRRTDNQPGESLVIRFRPQAARRRGGPPSDRAQGALRSLELTQPLSCSLSLAPP